MAGDLALRVLAQVTPTTTGNGDNGSNGEAIVTGGMGVDDWIEAAAILAGAVLVAMAIRRLVTRWVERQETTHQIALVIGRFLSAIVVLVGIVYALIALEVRIGPLLGALGIGGIALAFALQHVLENSVAAVLLQTRRPIRVGDQVTVIDQRGTVIEINFRAVVLLSEGGNHIFIPAAEVLRNSFTNHTTFGRRRTTLRVGVAYGTDLDRAQEVIGAAVSSAEGVLPNLPIEVLVECFNESSIDLAVRFWHPPRIIDEWRVRDAVAREVKRALEAEGIVIPFPQRRLWFPEPEASTR